MNHPTRQWVCAECKGHGPVWTFHVHRPDHVQELAQIPARCPLCTADALAIVPLSAPVSAETD
jgi:rubrerythrin